ncbi:MAG: DUF3793 family protein [Treponema sp.]|nr:DUF3793 family protein [Treponema sp.]
MNFSQTVIHFSAPTICGIKPANLFSVKAADFSIAEFRNWKEEFKKRGIVIRAVKSGENAVLLLVYNICWLRKLLADSFVSAYLRGKGYRTCPDVEKVVNHLMQRMKKSPGFPHEVGVILGYPVCDVVEFEKNEGRNCKYCGYWKSYSDVENARICQCRFKDCSCMCKKWFDEGYPLSRIIEEYKKAVHAA